jgi:MFS family permease
MLYVFRLMTCEAYYETHAFSGPKDVDRCAIREIEASTARAVSLLGSGTTIFGVLNLFVTGWSIKRFGVKPALLIQVFWPVVRLSIQNVGVMTGSQAGIIIVQCSQIITIIGGPNGYVLALNSYVADVSGHEDRTGALGRLSGTMMVGSAIGFLVGGVLGEAFGILAPFRITLVLFMLSTLYVFLSLPAITQQKDTTTQSASGLKRYFGPLHIFAPQKYILTNGQTSTQFGALMLGIGVFLAILATGYIATLLQMYSTNKFGFGTGANGRLIFLYSSLRGLFLSLIFPRIISLGRKWLKPVTTTPPPAVKITEEEALLGAAPTSPSEIGPIDSIENTAEPTPPPERTVENETYHFDLLYARYSIAVDCVLTGLAMFVTQGWQLYLVAVMLPLGAGTGAASKGTILQMLPKSERVDALSGITLIENLARLSTSKSHDDDMLSVQEQLKLTFVVAAVFGLVFAAFAEVGKSQMTFLCNSVSSHCSLGCK